MSDLFASGKDTIPCLCLLLNNIMTISCCVGEAFTGCQTPLTHRGQLHDMNPLNTLNTFGPPMRQHIIIIHINVLFFLVNFFDFSKYCRSITEIHCYYMELKLGNIYGMYN